MKKILFFILLIVSFQAFGQPTGYQKRIVNERIQGSFMVDSAFNMPRYYDTTAANLHKRSDSCGAIFFSYAKDSIYYRACNPKRWIILGSGGGGGGAVDSVTLNTGPVYDTLKYWIGSTGTIITTVAKFDFTSLADWDKLRYNSGLGAWVNFNSVRIDPNDDAIKMVVKDTVTNQEYYTDIPSGANSIQELDAISDLDDASGNAAIIDGRLWIKYTDCNCWRRQAYDTTYYVAGDGFLLDTVTGALGAYSLRQLRTGQTNCVEVYRSSDGATQTFGFVDGVVDTVGILAFVGGGNYGYITKWYDQSGNGNDATSTTTNGPLILFNDGTFFNINGRASLNMGDQSVPGSLALPTGFLNGSTNLSYFQVAKVTDYASSNAGIFGPSNTSGTGLEVLQHTVVSRRSLLRINNTLRNDNAGAGYQLWDDDTQSLTSIFGTPSALATYKNSGATTLTDASAMPALNFNGVYEIGFYSSSLADMNGFFQELIIYSTDKTSSRSVVEANINRYYLIY